MRYSSNNSVEEEIDLVGLIEWSLHLWSLLDAEHQTYYSKSHFEEVS
jgi:hypothetical protein